MKILTVQDIISQKNWIVSPFTKKISKRTFAYNGKH